jgi:Ca2+/Na+ antiporter
MLIIELFAALTVALILSALFALTTRKRGMRKGLFWLFLILFLATWAGGVWVKPFGPILWGIHWLSFLLVGAVVALILAVAQSSSRTKPQGRQETIEILERMKEERELEQVAWVTLTIFFWVLVLALLSAIIFRYVM